MGDLSLPDDPCPPDLGGLGQKVEIFDRPPLPAPFGTKVPSCPLARGPGAVLLVRRGLVGSSSELTSWIALLLLIVSISISFSSSFEAADCRTDSVLGIVVSFFCSGVVCGGGGVSSEEGATRGTGFSGVISSNVSNRVRQLFKIYFKYSISVLKSIGSRDFFGPGWKRSWRLRRGLCYSCIWILWWVERGL